MGLFCSSEGKDDELTLDGVTSIAQRDECFLSSVDLNESSCTSSTATRYLDRTNYVTKDGTREENVHPYAFSAKVQTHHSDTPTYKDILRLPEEERKLWDVSIVKEIKSLRDLGSFKMVPRPRGEKILASTWAFRKKIYPDGLLKKFKARFCVRGDQQVDGVDVFETFAPVVTWITVRILLILSMILQLQTQQMDYTNAFCQAPLD